MDQVLNRQSNIADLTKVALMEYKITEIGQVELPSATELLLDFTLLNSWD
jgi:hypothetical protein